MFLIMLLLVLFIVILLGFVIFIVVVPALLTRDLVRKNTGPGKFMQPGQVPLLICTIGLIVLMLIGIGTAMSQM